MSNAIAIFNEKKMDFVKKTKSLDWDSEVHFAIQAMQKNQMLNQCVPYTLQNAIVNVATIGLTLNPADGYAYLIPEYNPKTKQTECYLRVSFKGMIKLATDSGCIKWVKAEVVKENDNFTYRGFDERPIHEMNPFSKDRGVNVGVYCVAKTNDGDYLTDVMTWGEVQKIRACAKFDSVWEHWGEEMAKKAIIKRAWKQWPQSTTDSNVNEAIAIINEAEGIIQEEAENLAKHDLLSNIENAKTVEDLNTNYIQLRKLEDVTEADIKRFAEKKKELEAIDHGTKD